MTVEALRYRLLHDRPRFRASWLLLPAVVLWSMLVVAIALELVIVTYEASLWLVLGVPTGFALAALLALPGSPVRIGAGWTILVSTALIMPGLIAVAPTLAYVVPGLLVSAVVMARIPTAGVVGLFFLTGTLGSLQAFLSVPVGETADVLLFGLWAGALWSVLFHQHVRTARIWVGVAVLAGYLLITAVQVAVSASFSFGALAFRGSAWYLMAGLLVAYAPWPPGTRERMARGVVGVAAVVGAYATYRFIAGPAPAEYVQAASLDPTNFIDGDFGLVGSFLGRHALGAWTAIAIPFCFAAAIAWKDRWRILAVMACCGCAVGVVGSQVRTGMVAVVVGVVLVLALQQAARGLPGPRLGLTAAAVALAIVAGAASFAFTTQGEQGSKERIQAILTPTQDVAFAARLGKWETVIDDIDRYPFGQGLGVASGVQRGHGRFTDYSYDVDNSYLQLAIEQGAAVMLLFLAGLFLTLVGLVWRGIRTMSRSSTGLAIGAAGTLLAYMLLLATGGYVEGLANLAAWILIGLGISQFTYAPKKASAPRKP